MKGELLTLAVTDLNQDGVNEILYGHRETFEPTYPSISIIEKVNGEYKVIWESGYLGYVSRFFIQDKNIVVFTDEYMEEKRKIHLLQYIGGKYKVTDSIEIEGYPMYVGSIGNIKNAVLLCTEVNDRISELEKFGSYVVGVSLKNYKILEISTRFKEIKMGFTFTDLNGDKKKELLTFDGTWIRYDNGRYYAKDILAKIRDQFYLGPINMMTVDIDNDGAEEVVIAVANLETYIVDDALTGDYEAYLLDFSDVL